MERPCFCSSPSWSFVELNRQGAPFVAFLLVVRPGAPSSVLVTTSKALVTRSDALVTSSFLFLVAMPGAPSNFLELLCTFAGQ